ncbi:hypothetical protein I6H88_03130 [Elizabethkingia bruuniana]|uniref:Uncharacterized protein n=1 Tax=Elizabethkingia bruuniana TaxID=1756149 RepID=A0A7T7V0G2_9FLAO|nr:MULTISPECIES: hypothetical protein [Elizabethkingia]KGO10819.1 hypothetical protein KS04_07980 [Elizabethkingia miricola]AQX85893.1 hypothetical protein AYC65_13160 [Elizabethkingia bruuniana]KUY27549.1 hypothetical protein ATB97_17755 [Elizabethkingia bruuniana]OPB63728.1 hypothetical protein BAY12_10090 [Elizabethkingia bruuniana]QDZ61780.1 hypothetical protein EVD20_00920 [Elizabethkingia bruuniana]
MKTFLLLSVLASTLAFGQSKKIYTKQQLINLNKISYFPSVEGAGTDFDFYVCMQKNYKLNPKKYPEFMSKQEFDKTFPNTDDFKKTETYERNSLSFRAYGLLNYERRSAIQQTYPKCIKKSDIDW